MSVAVMDILSDGEHLLAGVAVGVVVLGAGDGGGEGGGFLCVERGEGGQDGVGLVGGEAWGGAEPRKANPSQLTSSH